MTDNQPIPVSEANVAVKAAIEVCEGSEDWEPLCDCRGYHEQCAFIAAARAGYAEVLEYLLSTIEYEAETGSCGNRLTDIRPRTCPTLYAAVAPIVQWHRAQGGKR